jgi:hypothetical protein
MLDYSMWSCSGDVNYVFHSGAFQAIDLDDSDVILDHDSTAKGMLVTRYQLVH